MIGGEGKAGASERGIDVVTSVVEKRREEKRREEAAKCMKA